MSTTQAPVKTIEEFAQQSPEYRTAIEKLVVSHAINELQGARVFDEPAIALAPTPYAKWLTCRVAMEEYAHHCKFFDLGRQIGIDASRMLPEQTDKKPLSMMGFPLSTWEEFVAIKLLADLAEILQVEDLLHCTFHPLRNLARSTMPEEKFHHDFGLQFGRELIKDADSRARFQDAVNRVFPVIPTFFGASQSKNNDMYRALGIKLRTNGDMRVDYIGRARAAATELGLTLPELPPELMH
jgi:ring-1,2-phenylacetyl-CoA epoxidase subunit PaaA